MHAGFQQMFLYLQPLSGQSSFTEIDFFVAQVRIDSYLCNPKNNNKFFENLERLVH